MTPPGMSDGRLRYHAGRIGVPVAEYIVRRSYGQAWCSLGRHWYVPDAHDGSAACRHCHCDYHRLQREGVDRDEARARMRARSVSVPIPAGQIPGLRRCNRCDSPFSPAHRHNHRCGSCEEAIRRDETYHLEAWHGRDAW